MKYIFMILFLITIFVFADFCGYDISCSVKKKITVRFFQGRINDIDVWEQKVADCCKKWLKKTPTVYDSDNNITLIDLFLNIHKRKSIQVWQTGSLLLALKEYANNNKKDIEYLDEIEKNIYKEYFQNSVLHADYGLLAFALLDSGTDLNSMAKYVIDNKTDNGVINYKANIKNVAFVDTLGFICPFLTKYGIVNNDKSFIILAKNQYDWYIKHGIEKHSKLPFHAVDCNSMTTMGICDWARGLAWFLIGIMDSYLCLKRCCGVDDSFYRNLIEKYAEILVKYQNNNGGFNWTLLSGGYITDSSATAVFGWFLACCANILNEDKYLKYAKKCRSFLMSVTNSDGAIDYCQGDTIGIGVYSRNFGIMPFAEAFALRMQEEIKSAK